MGKMKNIAINLDEDYHKAKSDKGKLRYDLIPEEILEALAEVYTHGVQKYGENTWQDVPEAKKRYKGAFLRHWVDHWKGDIVDKDSNILTLKQALWNVASLVYLECYKKEG